MTLEKHLEILSRENDRNLKLYQTWGILKRIFSQKLESVSLYFPHFSLHNSTHSETICMQIERFLGEERISMLSSTDTWMMLSAFYGHDLGMAIEFEEVHDLFQKDEFKEELYRLSLQQDEISLVAKRLLYCDSVSSIGEVLNYKNSLEIYSDIQIIIENSFRNIHAKRSSNYIKSHPEIFPDIPERFVNLLGDICEIHQKNIKSLMNLPYKSNGITNDYMHPRLIAALLCLGDLLDLDNDRFNEYIIKSATPLPKNSYLHLLKHKSVKHFLVEQEGIEIKFDTENIEVYRLMRDWCNLIEETCNFLLINWDKISSKDFGNAPILCKKELLLNHSEKWLAYSDLKFTITNQRAIELLQGANIYKDKFVCVRELIQNAIDATLIQIWEELTEKDACKYNSKCNPCDLPTDTFLRYAIEVNVSMDTEKNVVVTVHDKGTGINIEEVERISKIGNTAKSKKSVIIDTMPQWFKPSGAFGLGLQSIFLLTDRFEIITKTDNESAKRIIMESGSTGKGYILVDDYDDAFSRGTKVVFKVDLLKITMNDLYCSEYHYKTTPKCDLIMSEINNDYNNLYKDALPFTLSRRQITDYIPVTIKLYNSYLSLEQQILQYDSIFLEENMWSEGGFLESSGEEILFRYYDKETMTICKLELSGLGNQNNVYGEYTYLKSKFNETIFFKNVHVKSRINEVYTEQMQAVYRDIDFSINFLGNDAEKMLTISRNDIKKEYEYDFKLFCDRSIENTIKKLLDVIIKGYSINSLILAKLYQLSIFYNYCCNEFYTKYKTKLEQNNFNNYFDLESNEVTVNFNELKDKSINFLFEEVDATIFSLIEAGEIPELIEQNKRYFLLKNENKSHHVKKHILTHMISKIFIAKVNEKYYHCIEAIPFKTTSTYAVYEKDNFIVLNDFVCAIYHDLRCIRANQKYLKLSTPLNTQLSFNNNHHVNEMMIELPFSEEQRATLKDFVKNPQSLFNKALLLNKTFESTEFKSNVVYITGYNHEKVGDTADLYKKFLEELISLLTNKTYELYLEFIVEYLKRRPNWREGIYETIENNDYITF